MAIETPAIKLGKKPEQTRNSKWLQIASRIDPHHLVKPTGWLSVENRAFPMEEIDLIELIPKRGLHIRTRQESWLVSLPVEMISPDLLWAIISGEVNCLSAPCDSYEPSSES